MSFPNLDGKHRAELAPSPSLTVLRSVQGSSWQKPTAGGFGSQLSQKFNENPTVTVMIAYPCKAYQCMKHSPIQTAQEINKHIPRCCVTRPSNKPGIWMEPMLLSPFTCGKTGEMACSRLRLWYQ